MRSAKLGWATYGEDPSVNELQARVAGLLGKEAALWVPTCGMANLVALLALAPRGSAVVLEAASHVLTSEAMGIEEIAGLEPRRCGRRTGGSTRRRSRSSSSRRGATTLVLENTHTRAGGTVLSPELTAELAEAALRHGAHVHLDGARLANAAVALDVTLRGARGAGDTVALSLNKGLCAPLGAILAGSGARDRAARAHLRRLGGATVHKAGIAAAAALVALDTLVDRLADDHRRARELGALLAEIPGLPRAGGDRDEHRPRRRGRHGPRTRRAAAAARRAGSAGDGARHEPRSASSRTG